MTAPPSSSLFFSAATACGTVGLTLLREAGASGVVSGIEQVLRLAQAEPLLCGIEQWLCSPWDPLPCSADEVQAHTSLWQHGWRAHVHDPELAPPGTCLHLLLETSPTPPVPPLRAPALVWERYTAHVCLSAIPAAALAQLEEHALVWLPASFGPAWHVHLHDPHGKLPPCLALLDMAAQQLCIVETQPLAAMPPPDTPQAVLAQPVHIPLDHWLGWAPDTPCTCPLPQPWATQLRHGDTVYAQGNLLPLGQGCGLLIDSIAPAQA